jgi:hypothetical protein
MINFAPVKDLSLLACRLRIVQTEIKTARARAIAIIVQLIFFLDFTPLSKARSS